MPSIKLVGMDPSLRNWGLAIASYCLDSQRLTIDHLDLLTPELPTGKQVRQNSSDIESAVQLYRGATNATTGATATFVEIPVGSQSARAMASYALCVGVLGSMRASEIPFFELTPKEIKLAGAGKATATKQEMIAWAMSRHPEANWPTYSKKGKVLVTESKAEHMADAIAAIHAGLASNQFKQLLSFMVAAQQGVPLANPA